MSACFVFLIVIAFITIFVVVITPCLLLLLFIYLIRNICYFYDFSSQVFFIKKTGSYLAVANLSNHLVTLAVFLSVDFILSFLFLFCCLILFRLFFFFCCNLFVVFCFTCNFIKVCQSQLVRV